MHWNIVTITFGEILLKMCQPTSPNTCASFSIPKIMIVTMRLGGNYRNYRIRGQPCHTLHPCRGGGWSWEPCGGHLECNNQAAHFVSALATSNAMRKSTHRCRNILCDNWKSSELNSRFHDLVDTEHRNASEASFVNQSAAMAPMAPPMMAV